MSKRSLSLYILFLLMSCVIGQTPSSLLTGLVMGFDDARCFTHIFHKGASIGHFLHLPVISVEYDPAAENGMNKLFEQDRYPCPHFLLEMHSIHDTRDFFVQNPSLMKQLNLAHYVVILKQTEPSLATIANLTQSLLRKTRRVLFVMPVVGRRDSYLVYDHDPINPDHIQLFNIWTGNSFYYNGPIFRPNLNTLGGKTYSGAGFILPPFTMKNSDGKYKGFEIKIMGFLGDILDFKFTVTEVKGTWNGLVSHLNQEKATIGWAHFFITADRAKLIDFTTPWDADRYCFFSRKPPGFPKWMTLLMPFDTAMWVATSAMCAMVLLFLIIYTSRLNPAPEMQLYDLIMFCVGSLIDDCQGKSLWHIKSAKMRGFMIAYLLGTLVITCGYRSALFSMLTAPLVPKPLNTLQEIVDSPYQVGSVGPVVKGNLGKVAKMTNNELLMRFDKKYSLYRNLNLTMNEAFQKVESRELITYENSQMLEFRKRRDYTNELGETDFHISKECSKTFHICFGLPKNHMFTETFNHVITRLKEGGLILKFFKDEMDAVNSAVATDGGQGEVPLTLENLQGGFLLWALPIAFNLVIFSLEMIIPRMMLKFRKRNNMSAGRGLYDSSPRHSIIKPSNDMVPVSR